MSGFNPQSSKIGLVKTLLDSGDYPCSLQSFPGTDAPQVMIAPVRYRSLASVKETTPTLIGSLVFINDLLQSLGQEINSEIDTLQCLITIPLIMPKARERDFYDLLAKQNTESRLGAFGVNADGALYYRYNWQVYQGDLLGFTLLAIVEQAYLSVRQSAPLFEQLILGEI